MDLRVLEKNQDKTKVSLLIKDLDVSYVNALRRIMINRVPTLAIEDVEIRKNTSVMYDETIAHRLGLIPLTTDLKGYNISEECKCKGKGCAQCQVKLTLKSKAGGVVYAQSLKSNDPKIQPVYPNMPIVKLIKGQELELVGTATMNIGKVHSKWSPCHVYYKFKPVIDIKDPKVEDFKDPYGIFEVKNDKLIEKKDKLLSACLSDKNMDIYESENVKVSYDKETIIFFIESWGQLDAKEIVRKAVENFDTTLNTLMEEVKKL